VEQEQEVVDSLDALAADLDNRVGEAGSEAAEASVPAGPALSPGESYGAARAQKTKGNAGGHFCTAVAACSFAGWQEEDFGS
jgi:hypothetical protein